MMPGKNGGSLDIGSYWEASVGEIFEDPSLMGSALFDVAVIGAGYAGLSAALRLAEAGASVCVLDAKRVGWGASGRNGGFCCFGGSKLSEGDLIKRYGLAEARKFVLYQIEAMEKVAKRLDAWKLDVDRHSKGEMMLAHRPSELQAFEEEAAFLKKYFGYQPKLYSRAELAERGIAGPEFHGGLHVPFGFALNPMKYVQGLATKVREKGGRVFSRSPVEAIERDGNRWFLALPDGSVIARKVILAGNGYAREDVPNWLFGRTLPAMSSVMVTRPLTEDELAAQGWTSDLMAADTRTLLHYFRLLPDRRFLFGTRGGIFETEQALSAMQRRGRADFDRMFPEWRHVKTEYSWYGHVCLTRNLTPYVGPVPGMEGVFAAMAWHGSGIAMASLSGEKIADLALGKIKQADLPAAVSQPFDRFPFPKLRQAYLQGAYLWYGFRDR